jgi:hypothetical protein
MTQAIDETFLREKLRKIEALFAGAATAGENRAKSEIINANITKM